MTINIDDLLPPIAQEFLLTLWVYAWSDIFTPDRITAWVALIGSVVGNVVQYKRTHRDDITQTDQLTIGSLQRAYQAQGLELTLTVTNKEKLQKDFDSLAGEHQTLVGIDMKYVLDFAREGFLAENTRLHKRIATLTRRCENAGIPTTDAPELGSGEWRVNR